MKKLISKIRKCLCNYHKKRYEKLFAKMIGAKKYNINLNFSLSENEYMAKDKQELNSLYGMMVYGDTDSVKNR